MSRRYATGSTLIEWGNTRVICGVTVEESVPRWMKEQNVEGRLDHRRIFDAPLLHSGTPAARKRQGKIDGRSQEIQRLIGRAMRATLDLEKLGAHTIWVDCDVLPGRRRHAHGGHHRRLRRAVARHPAVDGREENWRKTHSSRRRRRQRRHRQRPAAAGFVLHGGRRRGGGHESGDESAGEFIELQGTGEEATFSETELADLLALGKAGIRELLAAQEAALAAA